MVAPVVLSPFLAPGAAHSPLAGMQMSLRGVLVPRLSLSLLALAANLSLGRSGAAATTPPPPSPSPATVGDRLWMWAHPAGFHDNYFANDKLSPALRGARSRITPVEAAVRLDLHNIMFVYESSNYTRCERGRAARESRAAGAAFKKRL